MTPLYKKPDQTAGSRVSDLLSRMTLREKIGQMTQLDITLINRTGKQNNVEINPDKARKLISKYHIGSFLNGEAERPEQWFEFMRDLTKIAVEESRLGIPVIYGIDHVHGANYLGRATIFPQPLNMAATFNPDHAFNAGRVMSTEAARLGHHWAFSPILDLGVNPVWARLYETFGEDPWLAGEMGKAYTKGIQENDEILPWKMAATGKHFIGYSDPRSGHDRTPALLPMQHIHEFHRPAFQQAVNAGLKTIMVNSGEVNGVPVHASHELLTKLLRKEMGFEGVIVTDWADVEKLVHFHYTAPNMTEAVYDTIMAGIDINMTPKDLDFIDILYQLVESGRIPESRIDESVRRILKLKFELGLFENPYPTDEFLDVIEKPDHRQKALNAAQESIILLNNDNILPAEKPKRIAVLGPSASSKRNLCGGWTLAWQGGKEEKFPDEMHTVFSAIRQEFPDAKTELIEPEFFEQDQYDIPKKLSAFDLLIYAGGEEPYCEFAGNISDLRLPENQIREIKLASKAGLPLVLVLIQGRPRIFKDVAPDAQAIIHAGLPGFEGAEAIAKIISGKVNPSGKLPISYPVDPNHFLNYNHKKSALYSFDVTEENQIRQDEIQFTDYPFGFGLSYTTFNYKNLKLSSKKVNENGEITATVEVKNSGSRVGTETVLWFTSTHYGRISRPVKELRSVNKVHLKPGESAKVEFTFKPESLSYPDENGKPVLEAGTYSVIVGGMRREFEVSGG